jgi:dihydrodipicolinate synthase/N-acetylneuraminate lyase
MDKAMLELHGLFAPVPSCFTDDGSSLSEARHARLIQRLSDHGVDGFVVATEAGEFTTLSHVERKALVEWTVREARGKAVIVHVSALSTSVALDLAQHAARHGARAAILTPPYYGEFSLDEVAGFFRMVAQYGGLPVVAVDPFEDFATGLWPLLNGAPSLFRGLSLAEAGFPALAVSGVAQPDEFALRGAICTPLALLAPEAARNALNGAAPAPAGLRDFLRSCSTVRAVKAAFAYRGLELGALRGPASPLPQRDFPRLIEALESAPAAA